MNDRYMYLSFILVMLYCDVHSVFQPVCLQCSRVAFLDMEHKDDQMEHQKMG